MSPTPIGAPPVAPSIAAQQAPLAQFAQQAAGGGSIMGSDQSSTSLQLAQSVLTQVGRDLEKVAKIIVVVAPELAPLLKSAVQPLGMLMNEITQKISPDNGAATQQMPTSSAGAVSAST